MASRAPRFLSIPDWEKLQEDRTNKALPWLKLHHSLLDDPRYRSLTKAQRADYIDVLMLARRLNNRVPDDDQKLCFYTREATPPDTQALVSAGLVVRTKSVRRTEVVQEVDGPRGEGDKKEKEKGEERAPALHAALTSGEKSHLDTSITIPCADGSSFQVEPAHVDHWKKRFPNVDVDAQLKRLAGSIRNGKREPLGRASLAQCIDAWLLAAQGRAFGTTRTRLSPNAELSQ